MSRIRIMARIRSMTRQMSMSVTLAHSQTESKGLCEGRVDSTKKTIRDLYDSLRRHVGVTKQKLHNRRWQETVGTAVHSA